MYVYAIKEWNSEIWWFVQANALTAEFRYLFIWRPHDKTEEIDMPRVQKKVQILKTRITFIDPQDNRFQFYLDIREPFHGLTRVLIRYLSGMNMFWQILHKLSIIFPVQMRLYITQTFFQPRSHCKNYTMARYPLGIMKHSVWLSGTRLPFKAMLLG